MKHSSIVIICVNVDSKASARNANNHKTCEHPRNRQNQKRKRNWWVANMLQSRALSYNPLALNTSGTSISRPQNQFEVHISQNYLDFSMRSKGLASKRNRAVSGILKISLAFKRALKVISFFKSQFRCKTLVLIRETELVFSQHRIDACVFAHTV